MRLVIYAALERKLRDKHGVTVDEVEETFLNRTGRLASEVRSKNQGEDPRYWFISETDLGRKLKVVFTDDPNEGGPVVITAYEPNMKEESLYESIQKKK